ncbi:TPA: M20/M25/M40 family metallo-hydrolase [bacterium]|nr:M20/M25/M40 family metallo-hydrolase [bacterium]
MERIIERLISLLRISSPSGKEEDVARFIRGMVERWGYNVDQDEMGNIFISSDKSPKLFLNAHMDTVTPCDNITPVIDGDIIKSDGRTILGADDKVGIAVILELLENYKDNPLPIQVIFTVQEEVGLVGAKGVKKEMIKAPCGFTLDAGGPVGNVIIGAPSQYTWTYWVYGVAAHAGAAPEKGVNAILLASRLIQTLPTGRINDMTTGNVGIISGGRATNIIPDEVNIRGEYRSRDEGYLYALLDNLERSSSVVEAGGGKTKLEYKKEYTRFDLKDSEFLKRTVDAMKEVGYNPNIMYSGGGSDANIFNELGITTLLLGISGSEAHSTREYAKISETIEGYKMLESVVKILCR